MTAEGRPILKSWVTSANDPASDFPLQNLPYGVFLHDRNTGIGVAIGDWILDLRACASQGLLAALPQEIVAACAAEILNPLMSLGPASWSALRRHLTSMLDADQAGAQRRHRIEPLLVPAHAATMQLPARIGDYTDFYASIHHATRVGKLFRPDNPLLPNYKYLPIGYHGRASSIVLSGSRWSRPCGQTKPSSGEPVFAPTQSLDYELEVGIFIGPGNPLGQPIPIAEAEQHVFGLCLVNDWSARDIQSWESQPLGPFLAKSFATTISPWIVPLEASGSVPVLGGGTPRRRSRSARLSIVLVLQPRRHRSLARSFLQSARMRRTNAVPMLLSRANMRDLYWTVAQLLTHHASNGCNLRPGDLLATGTISGPEQGMEGCLLEKKLNPEPIRLPTGEQRVFLQDGDRITFRACCQRLGLPRIGFGECTGTIRFCPNSKG